MAHWVVDPFVSRNCLIFVSFLFIMILLLIKKCFDAEAFKTNPAHIFVQFYFINVNINEINETIYYNKSQSMQILIKVKKNNGSKKIILFLHI